MKTQRFEYLDTLNILFSGRSATVPQAAGINKILAPPEDVPIGPDLGEADPPGLFSDSDIEENHRREKLLLSHKILQEKKQLYRQGQVVKEKNAQQKRLIVLIVKTTHTMVKKQKELTGGEQIASEMSRWTTQNAASLEVRRIEKLKPEARVMQDLNAGYAEELGEPNLSEFTSLVTRLRSRWWNLS